MRAQRAAITKPSKSGESVRETKDAFTAAFGRFVLLESDLLWKLS